jgi:Collagen triple helix repeat (20 copies)
MRTKVTLACALTAFVAVAGGTAEATGLIHTANIAKGAVTMNKLSPSVKKMLSAKATPGKDGATGVSGLDGAKGPIGPNGIGGSTGAAGMRGTDGAQGLTGAPGDRGTTGDTGLAGAAGIDGETGAAGETGAPGAPGATGATGATGAAGTEGTPGAPGADSNVIRPVTQATLNGFVLAPNGDNGAATPNGTVSFAAAADATRGSGVLDMETLTGKSVVAYLPAAAGRLLSELTSFGYASKVITAANNNSAYDVTAQIEVYRSSSTAFASGYTTVVFEPYMNGNQGTAGWHRNDMVHGKVWSTKALPSGNCSQALPCLFSQFVAENPLAIVLSAPKLRVGQNSGTPANDAGHYQVDDLIYGFGNTLNYDLGA